MPLRPAETINHLPSDTCCPLRTLPLAGTRCCMVAAIDSNGSAHTPQTIPVAHRCPAFVRQPALVSAVGPAWSSVHTRSSHCTVRGGLTQHPHATASWACAASARGARLEALAPLGYTLSPRATRQHMRLSARSLHWMSGYQRVREVEERQHAAGGAPARRHSRPGRLRSNVFVHEDLDVSHEEIAGASVYQGLPKV